MGYDVGNKYTATKAHKEGTIAHFLGERKCRPVKMYNEKTELIHSFGSMAEAERILQIPQNTIYYWCKKNKGRYLEDCIAHNGMIFINGEDPLF
jgi:hypothetical protein